jgi:hypothetical protein
VESTGGMVSSYGAINSSGNRYCISRTMNQPEEWLFRRELQAQGLGSHRRNGFPPEITSSERGIHKRGGGDSAGNHQLMEADIFGKIKT